MNITMEAHYEGELRCTLTHLASGQTIITDAPTDNQGRGMAFSPTDLLSISLASCMMTIMGITAQNKGIPFDKADAKVEKRMGSDPRRVIGIRVDISMPGSHLDEKSRAVLENAAKACPVARSLHSEIDQEVHFTYS